MKEIYLDPELKCYYKKDFTENVLTEERESWKISPEIKGHLISLNDNSFIQPLYSKYPNNNFGAFESYFMFSYRKEVEGSIFKQILSALITKYCKLNESVCYFRFFYPDVNQNYLLNPNSISKMGCLSNPNYFQINHITLYLECYELNMHEEFWNDLVATFNTLN